MLRFILRPLTRWLLLLLALPLGMVLAQDTPTVLTPDTAVTATLDAATLAQVYTFTAASGETATLTITSDTPVGLLLTDAQGTVLSRLAPDEVSSASTATTLPTTGTYLVTVIWAGGEADSTEYELTLTLEGTAPAATPVATTTAATSPFTPSTDVQLSSGMEVRLEWSAEVDLNLEVRDPRGNSLYWDNRTVPATGGNFGFDSNGLCARINDTPLERASWTPGFLPTGSYEILVFYRQSCVTPAQSVPFTVTVTVNGTVLTPIQGTLTPPLQGQQSVYLANFLVGTDGAATVNTGGIYPDTSLRVLPDTSTNIISQAQPLAADVTATGAIFETQPYVVYSFEATANQLLTISLTRKSGSLDTLLQVMDANGVLVDVNDDSAGTRNSTISNLRIITAGTYYIVATRYGKDIGGTEGEFDLLISGPSGELPPEVLNLGLPEGAIEVSLVWSTGADLQLLVRDPIGDAVFDDTPQVNSGGILAANGNVGCVRAQGTPASYIYWPNGFLRPGTYEVEVWYQNTCNDANPVEFTLTSVVNNQVVIAERQRPQPNQRFVIAFTVNPDGTATRYNGGIVVNNSLSIPYTDETPNPLAVGETLQGNINQENAFDVYAFDGQQGQTVTIAMNADSPSLDPKLFLIGPNGVEVAQNDDVRPNEVRNSLITAELPASGQYIIIATRYAIQFGGTQGTYRLSLQATQAETPG
jgi:hypothetical protein